MRGRRLLIACCLLLCLAGTAAAEAPLVATTWTLDASEVTLLQSDGQAMLIDAGPRDTAATLLADLTALRIPAFDVILITGQDPGYLGGLATVLGTFDTAALWAQDAPDRTASSCYQLAALVAQRRGMRFEAPPIGEPLALGSALVVIDATNGQLTVRVTHGENSLTFPTTPGTLKASPQTIVSDGNDVRTQGIHLPNNGP